MACAEAKPFSAALRNQAAACLASFVVMMIELVPKERAAQRVLR